MKRWCFARANMVARHRLIPSHRVRRDITGQERTHLSLPEAASREAAWWGVRMPSAVTSPTRRSRPKTCRPPRITCSDFRRPQPSPIRRHALTPSPATARSELNFLDNMPGLRGSCHAEASQLVGLQHGGHQRSHPLAAGRHGNAPSKHCWLCIAARTAQSPTRVSNQMVLSLFHP